MAPAPAPTLAQPPLIQASADADGASLLSERETAIVRWRCRRGLVENDLFLERFFAANGPCLRLSQARGLALLMDLSDNDLLDLLLRRSEPSGALATDDVHAVLEQLRQPDT